MPIVLANIFQPLITVFEGLLKFFHDQVGFGWGMSIIAMTVVVRAVIFPLTVRQLRSMQNMARLAPEMKALQQRYKDDKQRQSEEMMKFYKENKVNPFGSCLPLLLQFPVFLSLYYMLRKDLKEDICGDAIRAAGRSVSSTGCDMVDKGSAQFLFIPDLTFKATGGVLVVLIVLYVGSQLVSSLLTPTTDKMQKRLFVALPFLFVTFIVQFPAGLILYWITTNIWTIGQQQVVRRTMGPIVPPPATAGADATGKGKVTAANATGKAAPAPAGDGDGDGRTPPRPPRRKKKQRSGRRR